MLLPETSTKAQHTLGDRDVLKEQDDRRDGKLRGKRRDEVGVDDRLANVLEAARDILQNLDRVAGRGFAVTAEEPGGDGEHDDHKRIAQHRGEEEQAGWRCR